jgi:UDP-N-acetylglucosamine pyrophosphorylase
MKIYLSTKPPSDMSFKHCSNLAALEGMALDGEVTSLTIDCFLSSFSFQEVKEAVQEILKKCRMKCEVNIIEMDSNVIFRLYTRGEIQLDYLNNLFFNSPKKSVLNTDTIQSCIPDNFSIEEKSISSQGFSSIKIRRVV